MKYKDLILIVINILLISYIVYDKFFSKDDISDVFNRYEVTQKQILNTDSLQSVIYKRLDQKIDSVRKIHEIKLNEYAKRSKTLESKYKILRVSIDSLPDFE